MDGFSIVLAALSYIASIVALVFIIIGIVKMFKNIQTKTQKEALEETFIKEVESVCDIRYMKLIHAVIWLSLTTYAWNDYDMICGAFYNGLLYLEECLDMF